MAKGTRAEVVDKLADANKKLRAQVRQYRKELRLAQNELLLLQDLWQAEIVEMKKQRREKIKQKKIPECPQCGNPGLEVKTVGIWKLQRCEKCDFFNREQEEE